jgi:pimeloyl-[acyl-carrier protein] synthase
MSEPAAPPAFNPLDPEFAKDPFPMLEALRAADPVLPLGDAGFVVTGHAPAWEVLRRKDGDLRWLEFQRRRMGPGVENEPYCRRLSVSALMTAGEQHRRIRRTFQRSFTPGAVAALRGPVVAAAHRLIDDFGADGECELVGQFASLLPLRGIGQLLRVPPEDEPKLKAWMQGFLLAVQLLPLTDEQLAKANEAITSLDEYFTGLVAHRREHPPEEEDLLTKMIADADAGELSEDELVVNAWTLFVGGYDTSKLTMCNGVVALLEHPEQIPPLIEDPSLWPNAVEEIVRFLGPVQGTHRLLHEAIELGGHVIRPDTPVMTYVSAANRDEGWCPHANRFDIRREVPSDHLAFGTGPHKCPGQHMGRMMTSVALEALFTRLEGVRLVEVEWDTEVLNFRGPAKLHIAWDRARPWSR